MKIVRHNLRGDEASAARRHEAVFSQKAELGDKSP